jgi:hypothetical protein
MHHTAAAAAAAAAASTEVLKTLHTLAGSV